MPLIRPASLRTLGLAVLCLSTTVLGVANAQSQAKQTLRVNVRGLLNNSGQVIGNLFEEGDDLFGKPRAQLKQEIADQQARLSFEGLVPGRYALIVFHDLNGNNDLDHNMFRFPAEPLGYSNGFAFTLFSGIPNTRKLAFNVGPDSHSIDITVK